MMPNVYPGSIARGHGCRLVVSPRGTFTPYAFSIGSRLKPLFWQFIQAPALRSTACFHATSFSEFKDIRRLGFRQPVAIIPNGIDLPPLANRKRQEQRTLLFLGRIHPNKGLDLLIPAWRAVQDRFPEWRLRVVGPDEGGYLAEVLSLAKEVGAKRVKFDGALFGAEKWRAYSDADVYILPSYSENFGMTVAEALASGTPAAVSNCAPWEGLNENNAGWSFEQGLDPLVEVLECALACDPETLRDMGLAGRDWMARSYSWNSVAEAMANTYAWVAGRGERPKCVVTDQ
jgi:glycosyltransferase involved in cell wall biosynthesis